MFGKSSKKIPQGCRREKILQIWNVSLKKMDFFFSQGAEFCQEIVLMDKILDLFAVFINDEYPIH